jgi:hypothetical protein
MKLRHHYHSQLRKIVEDMAILGRSCEGHFSREERRRIIKRDNKRACAEKASMAMGGTFFSIVSGISCTACALGEIKPLDSFELMGYGVIGFLAMGVFGRRANNSGRYLDKIQKTAEAQRKAMVGVELTDYEQDFDLDRLREEYW